MNCPTWRVPRPHRPGNPAVKAPPVPATRFFDNLSYVGNEMVGCFVLDTGSGLICLDNMEPDDALYIEQGNTFSSPTATWITSATPSISGKSTAPSCGCPRRTRYGPKM